MKKTQQIGKKQRVQLQIDNYFEVEFTHVLLIRSVIPETRCAHEI
jgi:hypothetical protein